MDFSSIGVTPKGIIEIMYDTDTRRIRLRCSDSPLRSFHQALQALKEDIVTICDLSAVDRSMLIVRKVALKHHDRFGQGASITATRLLAIGPAMTLQTPLLYENSQDAPLPRSTLTRIYALEEEARKYIQGERRQQRLNL